LEAQRSESSEVVTVPASRIPHHRSRIPHHRSRTPHQRSPHPVSRITLPSALCRLPSMSKDASFDVTTSVDLQEVDNAVNQSSKEIAQRYDFKEAKVATVEFKRAEGLVKITADTDMRLRAMWDILQSKFIKRGVPVKNLDAGEPVPGGGDIWHRDIKLKQALDGETCKKVVAAIKAEKFKKVQASIQGDTVRVTSPSKDELQAVMTFLRTLDVGVQLNFGNYR
jgi:uncharacterized protein YajQ (UPF0234 family)